MKKIILISLFLGLIYFPFSCGEDCELIFNKISSLRVEFGALQPFFNNFYIRDSTTTDSAAFLIEIEEIENSSVSFKTIGFYPSAYAEEPPECNTMLGHELQFIEITSSSVIKVDDRVYNPGTNLNELFFSVMGYDNSTRDNMNFLIEAMNQLDNIFSDRFDFFYFLLAVEPDERISGTFTFAFIFDDRRIEVTSDEITIIPD